MSASEIQLTLTGKGGFAECQHLPTRGREGVKKSLLNFRKHTIPNKLPFSKGHSLGACLIVGNAKITFLYGKTNNKIATKFFMLLLL